MDHSIVVEMTEPAAALRRKDSWSVAHRRRPCAERACPARHGVALSLNMATPIRLFRPHTAVGRDDERPEQPVNEAELSVDVVEPPILPPQDTAIDFEVRVPPRGEITWH